MRLRDNDCGLLWDRTQEPIRRLGSPRQRKPSTDYVPKIVGERVPWHDPFLATHQQALGLADVNPLLFDADTWNQSANGRSAVGCDVECFDNFFLVCFERFSDGKRLAFEMSERAQIDFEMLRMVLRENTIVTFNGATYDLPMICLALRGMDCRELKRASNLIIETGMKRWDVEREFGFKVPKMDHIDLLEPNPSIRQGLKTLHGRLHGRFLVDLPFRPDAHLTREQMNVVTLYCFNDLDGTKLLWQAMREPLELRRALSAVYGIDMRNKSDAQIGEAIVRKRVETLLGSRLAPPDINQLLGSTFRYEVPSFFSFVDAKLQQLLRDLAEVEFLIDYRGKVETPPLLDNLTVEIAGTSYSMGIGGLHSMEKSIGLRSDENQVLVDIDVSSQYPKIIIKLGLYPVAMGPAFLGVYDGLIDERLVAKAAGEKVKAEGGKIALNGVYGKLGSVYSVLYAPHMMIAVTLTGQLSLLMLIERCEAAGIRIASANTDGVLAVCPRGKELELRNIIASWEADTGFGVESAKYESIHIANVNTYIAIREDGTVKRKGYIANPTKDKEKDWIRTQLMKNPQMTVCSDAVLGLIRGVPIEETIRACADPRDFITVIKVAGGATWRGNPLGRVVRYYWSTGGDPILYVTPGKTGNARRVAKTEHSRPLMELTNTLPPDLDYDHYIHAAKELAVDLGVIKEEKAA